LAFALIFFKDAFMEYVTLGRTNLMVSRSALGTRLLEDVSLEDSIENLNTAFKGGINFWDTLSAYSSVEEKIGKTISLAEKEIEGVYSSNLSEYEIQRAEALLPLRKNLFISSGTKAKTGKDASIDLDKSLENLSTDCIDIYHITNQDYLPIPGTDDGLYNEMLIARRSGKIRYIGFTTHNLELAKEAINSGLYDVLRFPLNIFSTEEELELIKLAEKADIGICAIKTLASGKIENVPIAFGFLRQYENLISVWGARNIDEIQKLLYFESNPPNIDEQFLTELEELKNQFKNQ
jgi:aryl-alcohol dehydrogenase-like predicted oxidoreductase